MTTRRRLWLAVLLVALPPATPLRAADTDETADRARRVLRTYCLKCHKGPVGQVKGDLPIFDDHNRVQRDLLVKQRPVVRPNSPADSELFQLVDCGSMPPGDLAKPRPEEVDALREWVADGAHDFPAEYGEIYVRNKIEKDINDLTALDKDVKHQRYVSFNHLLAEDADPDPVLWQDALVKALNHLSWEPKLVPATPIDPPADTIFRFDERDLGWDQKPFEVTGAADAKAAAALKNVDLFDLLLLEYPYATSSGRLDDDQVVVGNYVRKAGLIRPIAYLRGDWLVGTATQPPLYEDLLRLPRTLAGKDGLEDRIQAAKDSSARAAFLNSKMSGGPQLIERRGDAPTDRDGHDHPGACWRTFDPGPAGDLKGLLRAPDADRGGLMLFSLPNGLNGYYIAESVPTPDDKRLVRLVSSAPAPWLADPNAPDRIARNGLSCMRCHAQGVETFADAAGAALDELPPAEKTRLLPSFPGKEAMDKLLAGDAARFQNGIAALQKGPLDREPLTPVTTRFVRAAHAGPIAPAVLFSAGAGAATPVVAHRDPGMSDVVLNLAAVADAPPLPPLDGLILTDYPPPLRPAPVDVEITAWNSKTNPRRQTNTFAPGDEFALEIENKGANDAYIELIGALMDGRMIIHQPVRKLAAGTKYHYPKDRPKMGDAPPPESFTMQLPPGVDRYILFASDAPFPDGVRLRRADAKEKKVPDVAERVVHPESGADGSKFDPAHMVKKTLFVETR